MAESVYVEIPVEEVEEAEEAPSLTYRLDLENGRIIGKVDGLDAVVQAVHKALITPRWKCLAYDNQYGSEVQDAVIRQDASPQYIEAAVPGFIKDALLPDTRITSVDDFAFEFSGDAVFVSFAIETIFGETRIEEVF